MKNLKLTSQGIWISVDDRFAFKLPGDGRPFGEKSVSFDERREVARRFVACVNACEGFDTDGLVLSVEIGETLPVMRDRMIKRELELQTQRDELLAALEALTASCDTGERDHEGKQRGLAMPTKAAVWAAHDAIAKAKGGAA